MEMLNFSLWFTLVWWAIVAASEIYVFKNTPSSEKDHYRIAVAEFLLVSNFLPAITILLEYLIVR